MNKALHRRGAQSMIRRMQVVIPAINDGRAISSSDKISIADNVITGSRRDKNGTVIVMVSEGNADSGKSSFAQNTGSCTKNSFEKVCENIGSKTSRKILLFVSVLNVLQLILFFIVTVFILPITTAKLLYTDDVEFIMDHIPDRYIDYEYLHSQSLL